ncbi:MAG: 30S ribosomal protein S21 [Candidatus Heimdallarchaeota archaeon]|nr:30S ribosomal protein S21 [Candidatus Heimdallarchaeota archaeon]
MCVVRHEGESDDNLIRRFRKKCSRSGISREIRQRMYFEKPSNRRRRKKAQSIRYKLKEDKKLEEMRERARIKKFKLNRKKSKGDI